MVDKMNNFGWAGDAAEVVEIPAKLTLNGTEVDVPANWVGKSISKDNRRLLGAMVAGLPQVPCMMRAANDPLPDAWLVADRDTAGKAIFYNTNTHEFKVGAEGWKKGTPPAGSGWGLLVPKDYRATTYAEVTIIRISNQPTNKATGGKTPLSGSEEPPVMK